VFCSRYEIRTIAFAVLVAFSVALLGACGPSEFEREKLAFEKKKYDDEQAAKAQAAQKEEQDRKEQKENWMSCRLEASSEYDGEFKLWGTPVPGKPGVRNGPVTNLRI
jgi:hypothetical protein